MSDTQNFLLIVITIVVVWSGFALKHIFTQLQRIEEMLQPDEPDLEDE